MVAAGAGVEPALAAHERDESGGPGAARRLRDPRGSAGIAAGGAGSDLTASNALYVERPTSTTNATTTP